MSTMLTKRRLSVAACALMLLSLTGCFTLDPKSGAGNGFAYITDVRSARQGDTDRVVIEFAANKLPDWDVRIDAPPFIQDGSGKTIKVACGAAHQRRRPHLLQQTGPAQPARHPECHRSSPHRRFRRIRHPHHRIRERPPVRRHRAQNTITTRHRHPTLNLTTTTGSAEANRPRRHVG